MQWFVRALLALGAVAALAGCGTAPAPTPSPTPVNTADQAALQQLLREHGWSAVQLTPEGDTVRTKVQGCTVVLALSAPGASTYKVRSVGGVQVTFLGEAGQRLMGGTNPSYTTFDKNLAQAKRTADVVCTE